MKNLNRQTAKDTLKTLHGKTAQERLLHRLHCVVLVMSGTSSSKAGKIYGDSPRAVAYWVTRFQQNGIEGLGEEARSGRPSKLTVAQFIRLQIYLEQSKAKAKPVNAKSLSIFLVSEFGINLTDRQCWRILRRLKS